MLVLALVCQEANFVCTDGEMGCLGWALARGPDRVLGVMKGDTTVTKGGKSSP